MENIDFATLFQGFGTMMESGWLLSSARVFLIALGLLLIYLGWKGVLEPMVMIPMGLGMVAINCGTLFMPDGTLGNLFLDPMLSDTDDLMNTMQIDFLQPVYTLTFSNGLIACFVFMGIGTLLDVGFLLQKPFASIFLALCAELGTFLTVHRICIGTVLERKRFRSHGRRCGRADGAFHFLGPGQTSVCTHHGSGLSLSGTDIWRLPLSGEAAGTETPARHQDDEQEAAQKL